MHEDRSPPETHPENDRPDGAPLAGGAENGGRQAVALRYQEGKDQAPVVVASGRGLIADRILAVAAEHGIPIREDPDLIQLLARLDLGEEIPSQLYPIIAEVFAFIYRLNAEHGQKNRGGESPARR